MSTYATVHLPKKPLTAQFGLLVGQHALSVERRNSVRDSRNAQTVQRNYVALFLYYIQSFYLENKDEYEQLKSLSNLEEIIQVRFIRLIRPSTENLPYRQIYYVFFDSSNEVYHQQYSTTLSDLPRSCKRLMHT